VRSGVRLLVLHMETWGILPGIGQEKLYTGQKQKTHRGRPLQSANDGWNVPTKQCGYFEVNLSLYQRSDVQNWDGTGGNGAAVRHFEATGKKYPLAVKLGTITPHSADVFSYAEDDMVTDPDLVPLPPSLVYSGLILLDSDICTPRLLPMLSRLKKGNSIIFKPS